MAAVQPQVTLAFALRGSPGAYALLLGAGLSVAAGVPSAWGVQELLILRVAATEGEEPADPAQWYAERFGVEPTYDGLLGALAHTQAERQALLRGYFEPTDEEREQGLKQPTTAHRAVARLVAAGLVQVVLTTNFDLLLETALRDEGVEPTVVSNPAALLGLPPLHTQRHLVVHLHGDYLDPTGMLNTAEELGSYPAEVDVMLDKLLPERGLLVVGWSATWDAALRAAVSRNPCRFFSTYWVDPAPLSEAAERLRALRRAMYVQSDADTFLGQLEDASQSLAETERRHPLTAPLAVATAKRALSGGRVAIPLHDRLRAELEALRGVDALLTRDFDATDVRSVHASRLARLGAAMEVPLALVATAAYWGDPRTDEWWLGDVARFGAWTRAGGLVALIELARLPATALLYAAGVAATAAGRADLVARLLTEPTTTDYDGRRVTVASHLTPQRVLQVPRAHRWLHEYLRPLLQTHLGLGAAAYLDASERFEYVRLAVDACAGIAAAGREQEGPAWDRNRREFELRVDNARRAGPATFVEQEERALHDAEQQARERQDARSRLVRVGLPHLRVVERGGVYRSVTAEALTAELDRDGQLHPLVQAGLCGGDAAQLLWATVAVDGALHRLADEVAWSAVPGMAGFVPMDFVLDETGKWAGPTSAT